LKKYNSIYITLILLILVNNILFSQGWNKAIINPFKSDVFIENHGQFDAWLDNSDKQVHFGVNRSDKIFFKDDEVIFRIDKLEEKEGDRKEDRKINKHYITLKWVDAKKPKIEASNKAEGYYTFGEKGYEKLQANGYRSLLYKNIYAGIDVDYYLPNNDSNGLKYNITLHPNSNPNQLKIAYLGSINDVTINEKGNLLITSEAGVITDHKPIAYYKESGKPINVSFKRDKNNIVSFSFNEVLDHSKTIVIDPWVTTPSSLTTDGKAYDVDFDDQGNIYVAGGTRPHKFAKYDNNGSILWTYTLSNEFDRGGYSEFGLLRNSGAIYFGLPLSKPSTVLKISSNGTISSVDTFSSPNNEIWTIFFNPCNKGLMAFGGGTSGLENLYLISDTLISNVSQINSNGAQPAIGCCNDITDAIIDINGDFYALTVGSVDNRIFKSSHLNGYQAPPIFDIYSGHDFDECGCYSTNFSLIGAANVLALNSKFLFSYDGKTVKAWDKTNGSILGSVLVNSTYGAGRNREHQGIVVDEDNYIYVAGNRTVHIYKFNGSSFLFVKDITQNILDEVYDIMLDLNRKFIYVVGNNFISSTPIDYSNSRRLNIKKNINCNKVSLEVTGGTEPYSFQWSNGETTSEVTLNADTNYVIIKDYCNLLMEIDTIIIESKYLGLTFIPNVFSPNNDGINDFFKIRPSENKYIKIYNRWGCVII
jgi:hypothetical protein